MNEQQRRPRGRRNCARQAELRGAGAIARGAEGRGALYKNYWEAQKWRKVSAGYMICATFALAQKRRETGAPYVVGGIIVITFS